ncbi:hypothetical protein IMZ48_35195 [Candidatus Bathyarchaeota archaeon]|nr:hypothetical protein [Candidatus Bathyarchaeota archaeon]
MESVKPTKRQTASTKTQKTRKQPSQTHSRSQSYQHDEYLLMPLHDVRDGSHTPPLYSQFSAYTPPSEASMSPYGHMHSYMPVTTLEQSCSAYMTAAATTLPPMSRLGDDGRGGYYAQEDPFASGLNYGFIPGINIDASHHYDAAGPHVSSPNYPPRVSCSSVSY